jgi:hypothetical protein
VIICSGQRPERNIHKLRNKKEKSWSGFSPEAWKDALTDVAFAAAEYPLTFSDMAH